MRLPPGGSSAEGGEGECGSSGEMETHPGICSPRVRLCTSVSFEILRTLCHGAERHGGVQIRHVNRQKQKRHCNAVPFLFLVTHPGIEPEFPA